MNLIKQPVLWTARFIFRNRYHSKIICQQIKDLMDIHVISALTDNYMYLIVDKKTGDAAVVDPVEPDKIIDLIKTIDSNVRIRKILTTHHHWDHAGGNKKMLELLPDLMVVGGDERIDCLNYQCKHGECIKLSEQLSIECLSTPCHTSGHICYKISSSSKDDDTISVFTGDTLFIGGCGKFFEGNAQQMYDALINVLGSLPDHSKIYCGHEYTLNNLKFAKHVEPENAAIDEKIKQAEQCLQENRPTIPSTIGDERKYNPFMRIDQSSIKKFVKKVDPVEVMAALREEKNQFKIKK